MGEEPFRWENMLQENEADTLAILLRIKNESAAATGSRIRSSVGDQQFEDCNDWVSRLGMGFVWWCLPLAVGVGAGYFASSSLATVLVWIVSFDLDGNGLHFKCASLPPAALLYIGAGLFLGAAALTLFEAGVAFAGPHSLNNIVGITLTVALLSFVPEMIWRKRL